MIRVGPGIIRDGFWLIARGGLCTRCRAGLLIFSVLFRLLMCLILLGSMGVGTCL
jgi:hypothetical protein